MDNNLIMYKGQRVRRSTVWFSTVLGLENAARRIRTLAYDDSERLVASRIDDIKDWAYQMYLAQKEREK